MGVRIMKNTSISVTVIPDRNTTELTPFSTKWNTPVNVKITKITQITPGPFIYYEKDINSSSPSIIVSDPKK